MSSVFNDRFNVLSDRIDRIQTLDTPRVGEGPKSANGEFAKILADLEQHPEKTAKKQQLTNPLSSTNQLSNLSAIEAERANARLEGAIRMEQGELKVGRAGVEIVSKQSVKNTAGGVNEIPGEQPTNLKMMPYLQHAKYSANIPPSQLPQLQPKIEAPSVSPPAVPKLLSVQEVSQPKSVAVGSKSDLKEIIVNASNRHGVDPALSIGLAMAESSLNPTAVSKDGFASKGLFQLLDTTGNELAKNSLLGEENYDPFNPDINADLGVRYVKRLMETFSTQTQIGSKKTFPITSQEELEKVAIAAFNAGEGRVTAAQHRAFNQGLDPTNFSDLSRFLPKITQNHVERVMRYRSESMIG